jgi:hypothetical protein
VLLAQATLRVGAHATSVRMAEDSEPGGSVSPMIDQTAPFIDVPTSTYGGSRPDLLR